MPRSTDAQKGERVNAAHSLLARGVNFAAAVGFLSRDFGLSRRQAYRYLREAQTIGHPVAVGEPAIPVTLKIPANVVRELRAYSAASGVTQGEIVARALTAFLAAAHKHG
jgi:hypothetical protein